MSLPERTAGPRRRLLTRHPPRDLHRARQLLGARRNGEFTFLGGARTIAPGRIGFALGDDLSGAPSGARPSERINRRSRGPGGRPIVEYHGALFVRIDRFARINLALPFTTYRTGTGLSAIASQHSTPLSFTALRDTRIGVTLALLPRARALQLASRWELSVPTGDASAFAGDRSFVGVPSFVASWRDGPFVASAELGARLQAPDRTLGIARRLSDGRGARRRGRFLDQRLGARLSSSRSPHSRRSTRSR